MESKLISAAVAVPARDGVEVLLVEDDRGDALLVEEMLATGDDKVQLRWVRTLREATECLPGSIQCVLLDLGLPDASGLDALTQVLAIAPRVAAVVITGLAALPLAAAAVRSGAQDYLVKGEVDGQMLSRSIRYAVERKRAERTARLLLEAELRSDQNIRLQRGLLPELSIADPTLDCVTGYRPGGEGSVLGGDFYDALEQPDGTLRVVIGDVAGHGPDEAALGVSLRIAWRALVLAGHTPDQVLATLDELLCRERRDPAVFTTLADLAVAPDRRSGRVRLAGHPVPLALWPQVRPLTDEAPCPPLGVIDDGRWPGVDVELGASWRLLLYTDGLIEGRIGPGPERLGVGGLISLAGDVGLSLPGREFIDEIVARAGERNGGPASDDLALLLLTHFPGQ